MNGFGPSIKLRALSKSKGKLRVRPRLTRSPTLSGVEGRLPPVTLLLVAAAFAAGLLVHVLYQRWSAPSSPEDHGYPVAFVPLPAPAPPPAELPLVQAREVDKIKSLAGSRAKIRGRVFRVGLSEKSNTYFINFGPSRGSFTAVIFASAVDLFEKKKLPPKSFEGKELELTGEIKDHPQYGLEMILENPAQVKLLD
ncbi:MAG TPA: hypothetical protein VGL11_14620 [Candidatus Binatia bacterium]